MTDRLPPSADILTVEEVGRLREKSFLLLRPSGVGKSRDSVIVTLCDSHERLRLRADTAERALQDAESRYQAEHEALAQAVQREVENRERAERAEAALQQVTAERDAARLERDEADDSRESLRLELRASESNRISDARELLRRAEAAEAALATVTQELEGANARIEVMQDIIRSNE